MKKIILALLILASFTGFAEADSQRNPCFYNLNGGCQNVPTSGSIDDPVTGSISATAGTVVIPTNGRSTVGLSVTGTWSGALSIKASVDYSSVGAASANYGVTTAVSLTSGTVAAQVTANGVYQINAAGFSAIQIYGTNIASGTANITLLSSDGVSTIMADNNLPITCTLTTCIFASGPYSYTPTSPMQSGLTIATSTALTVPATSIYAVVCARGQNVNYTTDGATTPTASVGMQLLQNQCIAFSGATVLSNFRAIQQAATATLDVSYFK